MAEGGITSQSHLDIDPFLLPCTPDDPVPSDSYFYRYHVLIAGHNCENEKTVIFGTPPELTCNGEHVEVDFCQRTAFKTELSKFVSLRIPETSQSGDANVSQAAETSQAADANVSQVAETSQAGDANVPQVVETSQAADENVPQVAETSQAADENVPQVAETSQAADENVLQVKKAEGSVIITLSYVDMNQAKVQEMDGYNQVHMIVYLVNLCDGEERKKLISATQKNNMGPAPKILVGTVQPKDIAEKHIGAVEALSEHLGCFAFGVLNEDSGFAMTELIWKPILRARKIHFLKHFIKLDRRAAKTMRLLIAGLNSQDNIFMKSKQVYWDKENVMEEATELPEENEDGRSRTFLLRIPTKEDRYRKSRKYDLMKFQFTFVNLSDIQPNVGHRFDNLKAIFLMYAMYDETTLKSLVQCKGKFPEGVPTYLIGHLVRNKMPKDIPRTHDERREWSKYLNCAGDYYLTNDFGWESTNKVTSLKLYNEVIIEIWREWKYSGTSRNEPNYFAISPQLDVSSPELQPKKFTSPLTSREGCAEPLQPDQIVQPQSNVETTDKKGVEYESAADTRAVRLGSILGKPKPVELGKPRSAVVQGFESEAESKDDIKNKEEKKK